MKISFYGFCILLIFFQTSIAQTGELNSLLGKLKTSKMDTNRVRLLFKIGDEYAYNDIKTARKYYANGYELSQKLDYLRGKIRYFSSEGELLNLEGKYAQTMNLLREGVKLSVEKNDKMRQGIMYENMGNTLALMQKLDTATNYYFKSLQIFENFKDSVKIANVYNDLSTIFNQTDKTEIALKYINQAIAISRTFQDGFYLSHLINKEAILWKLKRENEAENVNNQILVLAQKLNDKVAISDALQNQCEHDVKRRKYENLQKHALELSKLRNALQSNEQNMISDYWLSVSYFYQKKYQEALYYIQKTIDNSNKTQNINHLQMYFSHYAKVILVLKKDPILAAKYNSLADSLQELSLNKSILKNTKELATKYDTEKKETVLKQLYEENRNRKRQIALLIFSVLVLLGALILFGLWIRNRNRIRRQEQKLHEQKLIQLENEKQLLASKAVLQGQDEERTRLAKDLHDGLGGILSSVKYSFQNMKQTFILQEEHAFAFEKSMNLLDTSLAELRRVSHNMMPESLAKLGLEEALRDYISTISENSGIKFTYQSFGLPNIALENIYKTTIFRVIQELTTNIIRHSKAETALVEIIAEQEKINITIEDDGIGFMIDDVDVSKSMGIQNLYNRITYLKGKISFESTPNEGCAYYIEIPIENETAF